MKLCTKCNKEHPIDRFPLTKAGSHTRRSICKDCKNSYTQLYRTGVRLTPVEEHVKNNPIDHSIVPSARMSVWDRPVYVQKPWGR